MHKQRTVGLAQAACWLVLALTCTVGGVALAAGSRRPSTLDASCADAGLLPTPATGARAEAASLCLVNGNAHATACARFARTPTSRCPPTRTRATWSS